MLRLELARRDRTNKEHARLVASLPLLCPRHGVELQPFRRGAGTGRSRSFPANRFGGLPWRSGYLRPLQMFDTGFHIEARPRRRSPGGACGHNDPWTGKPVKLFDMLEKPVFEAGGRRLVSTAPDYARFAQMLLNGGVLDGVTHSSAAATLQLMTADHLGPSVAPAPDPYRLASASGSVFAVRTHAGLAPFPGSVGQYFWNGSAGTQFWADPAENLWALLMVQAPSQREHLRVLIKNLVYAAIED